jgi:hypothetical protein
MRISGSIEISEQPDKTEGNTEVENIRWEDPPPSNKRTAPPGKYVHIADALRQRPGEWAIVSDDAQGNMTYFIKNGTLKGFGPPRSFEAVSRVNPGYKSRNNMRSTIYARYIG